MKTHDEIIIPPAPKGEKVFSVEKNGLNLTIKSETLSETKTEIKTETTTEHTSTHHISESILRTTCIVALVLWLLIIVVLSIVTVSSPFNTFIGLSPVFFTILVSYILVDKYHMESGFLMVFPFIFTGILLVLGVGGWLSGIDYLTLAIVNIVFGLLFEASLVTHHSIIVNQPKVEKKEVIEKTSLVEPVEIKLESRVEEPLDYERAKKEPTVKEIVQGIEDKAKAINSVIGRAYSVKHGGTEEIRKKIRIDPMHYNEFSKEKGAKKTKAMATLLTRIKLSLSTLELRENQVFTKTEISKLKFDHEPTGSDRVIDVLAKNDSDPVKVYYKSAVEFCENALKRVEEKN